MLLGPSRLRFLKLLLLHLQITPSRPDPLPSSANKSTFVIANNLQSSQDLAIWMLMNPAPALASAPALAMQAPVLSWHTHSHFRTHTHLHPPTLLFRHPLCSHPHRHTHTPTHTPSHTYPPTPSHTYVVTATHSHPHPPNYTHTPGHTQLH